MAKRKVSNDPNTLSGRHIYRDEKGRILYYNPRTLVGYVIQPENVIKYRQLNSRYIIGLLGAMVGVLLFEQWGMPMFLGPVIGIACCIFMEYQFRSTFLTSLVQVHHFIPKDKPKLIEGFARESIPRLALKAVLYVSFAILLLIDLYVYLDSDTLVLSVGWIIAIIASGLALFNVYAIFYQKTHPEVFLEKSAKKGRKTK